MIQSDCKLAKTCFENSEKYLKIALQDRRLKVLSLEDSFPFNLHIEKDAEWEPAAQYRTLLCTERIKWEDVVQIT